MTPFINSCPGIVVFHFVLSEEAVGGWYAVRWGDSWASYVGDGYCAVQPLFLKNGNPVCRSQSYPA